MATPQAMVPSRVRCWGSTSSSATISSNRSCTTSSRSPKLPQHGPQEEMGGGQDLGRLGELLHEGLEGGKRHRLRVGDPRGGAEEVHGKAESA